MTMITAPSKVVQGREQGVARLHVEVVRRFVEEEEVERAWR